MPELIYRIATAVHNTLENDPTLAKSRCILATRTLIEVADYYGIPAEPVVTTCGVYNRAALELRDAGVPVSEWPAHAYSVGTSPSPNHALGNKGGFDGHLIAIIDGHLIDAATTQFARPAYGIELPAPICIPLPHDWVPGSVVALQDTAGDGDWNCVAIYERETVHADYRTAPDWRRNYRRPAAAVIRTLKAAA